MSIKNDTWKNIDYYSVDHNVEAFAGSFAENNTATFTDADGGMDPKDRKVIQGQVYMMNGGATCWKSHKIDCVTRSTTAAEYISVSNAVELILWAAQITAHLEDQPVRQHIPLVFCDNKAAVQLSKGISNTSKIKHIDACYHQILDEVRKGRIMVFWIRGNDQLADGFTKPLSRVLFQEKRSQIGVRDLSDWINDDSSNVTFSAWFEEEIVNDFLLN